MFKKTGVGKAGAGLEVGFDFLHPLAGKAQSIPKGLMGHVTI